MSGEYQYPGYDAPAATNSANVPEREVNAHVASDDRPGLFDAIRQAAAEGAQQGMAEGLPGFQQQAKEYGRDVMIGMAAGRGMPNVVPDVTAVTAKGKELVVISNKGDAKNRALRTFLQGLGLDIVFALLAVLTTALAGFDFTSKAAWTALGILLIKTIAQTVISYLMRLRIKPNYEKPQPIEGNNAT